MPLRGISHVILKRARDLLENIFESGIDVVQDIGGCRDVTKLWLRNVQR